MKKNKKIVFFVSNIYIVGGIERVVSIIANMLYKKYDVMIISLFKTSQAPKFHINENVKVYSIFNKEMNIRKNYIYIKNVLKRRLCKLNCDVFINCGMGLVPLNIFMYKKAKYVSWEHSNCCIGKKFGLTWMGRYLSKKYADKIVFLTIKDMNNYIKKFKVNDTDKCIQIYNPTEWKDIKKEYNVYSNKIISVGRLEYQKGFDILVDVAKIVFANKLSEKWTWDIYGEGKQRKLLEKKIKRNNLVEKVNLKGNVENVIEKYRDYSIFVLTSRYEGFCMVNIEAAANKLPIVSFNCDCGPDEIILNNKNGYLIDDFNKLEMANKILKLIGDADKRVAFSNNSNLDKEKLQLSEIEKRWEQLLEERN